MIHDQTVHLAKLVNHMLESARLNSGCARWNWSTVRLAEACDDAFNAIRQSVDHAKVDLAWQVDPAELTINGNPEAIRRLVINLVGNSVKHTSEGSIRVTVAEVKQPGGRWIELQVQDTGGASRKRWPGSSVRRLR